MFLGPWAGLFTGWTYWFCWVVTGVADVIAIAGYVHFWWPDLPGWIPAIATIILLFSLNMLSVRLFGETEFWFSLIKIIAIVALIVVGFFLMATSYRSPDGVEAALSNLWTYGGVFPERDLWAFSAGFQIAIFAFVGIELVGTTAAETQDPEKTLPKAINSIPIRIIFFYVFALMAIMAGDSVEYGVAGQESVCGDVFDDRAACGGGDREFCGADVGGLRRLTAGCIRRRVCCIASRHGGWLRSCFHACQSMPCLRPG